MVLFWPWKGDDSSPATFEKTLAKLSEKIQKNTVRLDSIRQQSRRFSVLWMLYASIAYLLYAIILILVVGWRNWGATECSIVAGGPVVIYFVRLGLTNFYDYRTSALQAQADDLQNQRDVTIKRLKTATKYDSTQELLQKYEGTPTPKPKPAGGLDRKVAFKQSEQGPQRGPRTAFVPPPTANIPERQTNSPQHDALSQQFPPRLQQPNSPLQQQFSQQQQSPTADFAPNAFPSAPQYAPTNEGPHWYDRFMDVLLGEDETLPGKRLVLICSKCRLVNGQAPPGVKKLEDIGKWRCGGCGTMNGEENDIKILIEKIKKQDKADAKTTKSYLGEDGPRSPVTDDNEENDVTVYTEDEEDAKSTNQKTLTPEDSAEIPVRRSARHNKGMKEG